MDDNVGLIELIRAYSMPIRKDMVICAGDLDGLEETVQDLSFLTGKFEGCYTVKDTVICFIYRGTLYVTPKNKYVISILKKARLKEEHFYTPFGSMDYPKNNRKKWEDIKMNANELVKKEFLKKCAEHCKQNGIGELAIHLRLGASLPYPDEGIVIQTRNKKSTFKPEIRGYNFNQKVAAKLGTYNHNASVIVYVAHDGKTYMTRCYSMKGELERLGYRCDDTIPVPFRNGGYIMGEEMERKWNILSSIGAQLPMPTLT